MKGVEYGSEKPGIIRPEDLPKPIIKKVSRNFRRRPCPICNKSCYRDNKGKRLLHDLGDSYSGRPRDIHAIYSRHRCEQDKIYFSSDISDLAPPGSHYTHKVISMALRLVIEDGLPYRSASWHLWRDHRVFVPFATVQNWIEDVGKKKRKTDKW